MDENDGPFAGIIRNCVTAADEEELRNCPFTVEFENFPESFVSQSSSPANSVDRNSARKNENIQTPQEHQYSQTCISDDQRPTAVDLPANVFDGEGTVGGYRDGKEAQVRVHLGEDNDNLGSREITVNGYHGINEVEYSEGDIDEPLKKRIRVCEKNLRMHSSIPQITDLEVEVIVLDEVDDDNRIKRKDVDFALTESEDSENHEKKQANGIKGSSSGDSVNGSVRGRRELPLWMKGEEEEGVGRKTMKKGQFKDIVEVTVEVLGKKGGGENKDVDFLKTAKSRDMLFPRPRWWSPEMFID